MTQSKPTEEQNIDPKEVEKLVTSLLIVSRNAAEVAIKLNGDGHRYNFSSKSQKEDIRSLLEIAEHELKTAKGKIGKAFNITYSE